MVWLGGASDHGLLLSTVLNWLPTARIVKPVCEVQLREYVWSVVVETDFPIGTFHWRRNYYC